MCLSQFLLQQQRYLAWEKCPVGQRGIIGDFRLQDMSWEAQPRLAGFDADNKCSIATRKLQVIRYEAPVEALSHGSRLRILQYRA